MPHLCRKLLANIGLHKQLVQHQLSSVQETSCSPSRPLGKARAAAITPFLALVAFTEDGFQPPPGCLQPCWERASFLLHQNPKSSGGCNTDTGDSGLQGVNLEHISLCCSGTTLSLACPAAHDRLSAAAAWGGFLPPPYWEGGRWHHGTGLGGICCPPRAGAGLASLSRLPAFPAGRAGMEREPGSTEGRGLVKEVKGV